MSDVHETGQVARAAEVLDIIQIPAFLCRQTDLLLEAARAGKPVNIKKGQFLAPGDMKNVVDKVLSQGNEDIILTERGTSFGYHNLVFDVRAVPILKELGFPVCVDASHSVQRPGARGTASGGDAAFIPHVARAAIAVGADGLFLEVHDHPAQALSDSANSLILKDLNGLLVTLRKVRHAVFRARR
jgi:2-dehydro-3-deoxyphosphooctonate aldolase (KDO 8-P synthase)